jgi:predicted Mrr-cat superfamily restriction endonuclease
MPFFLRKIRKGKWYKHSGVPWLSNDDLQADALADLQTQSNRMSVYYVKDDRSNLSRVIAAMAARCDFLSNIDYALVAQELLDEIDIRAEKVPGSLPDSHVSHNWHQDLYELTASDVMSLAMFIRSKAEIERTSHSEVLNLVAHAITSNHISRSKLNWKDSDKKKLDSLLSATSAE